MGWLAAWLFAMMVGATTVISRVIYVLSNASQNMRLLAKKPTCKNNYGIKVRRICGHIEEEEAGR